MSSLSSRKINAPTSEKFRTVFSADAPAETTNPQCGIMTWRNGSTRNDENRRYPMSTRAACDRSGTPWADTLVAVSPTVIAASSAIRISYLPAGFE